MEGPSGGERGARLVGLVSLACFLAWTWTSWARWASFSYRTFDLAYYVQGLWQLIHGRFAVSVEYVPLLGNHVEPIIFLIAPIFFVFRHPMTFVVLQNASLAATGLVAYGIARRYRLGENSSALLALAILLTPATGYVALHEFHPEALTAPFLLLLWRAQMTRRLVAYWIWFAAVLACKENMALLLAAYCVVQTVRERKRNWSELQRWFVWPLLGALCWFVLCTRVITPALNSGNIDYLALYDRLGASGGAILRNFIVQPQLALGALRHSLGEGNLLWALLLPFLALPLLRPQWLLIAAPILLQHLLSWRSSEWTIFFHYAAPLIPIFWIATVEALVFLRSLPGPTAAITRTLPVLILVACLATQFWLGPANGIVQTTGQWFADRSDRLRKAEFIRAIPPEASVVAPLPYLSHLAMRQELHSLHYILKGLKTLSRSRFQPPPPTDFVLLNYGDAATFDRVAGYFHPRMRTAAGATVPSSEELLHSFLSAAHWQALSRDDLTLLRKVPAPLPAEQGVEESVVAELGPGTRLLKIEKSGEKISNVQDLDLRMTWSLATVREVFPWMILRLTPLDGGQATLLNRGLSAIEAGEGIYEEKCTITLAARLRPGNYRVEALFIDRSKSAWQSPADKPVSLLAPPVPLGELEVTGPLAGSNQPR